VVRLADSLTKAVPVVLCCHLCGHDSRDTAACRSASQSTGPWNDPAATADHTADSRAGQIASCQTLPEDFRFTLEWRTGRLHAPGPLRTSTPYWAALRMHNVSENSEVFSLFNKAGSSFIAANQKRTRSFRIDGWAVRC
jgi:hypothetical protein